MSTTLRRVTRTLTYALLAVLLLAAVALLLLRTQWVKRYLLDLGLSKVNNMLTARLAVGDISGSLFGELELSDISLVRETDTVCTIGRIKLGYQLWPLIDRQVKVDSVIIDSVVLSLTQYADSNWNITGLMKSDSAVATESATTDEPFGYALLLDNFTLRNAAAAVNGLDSSLHLKFEDILLQFAASYADSASHLSLHEVQVQLAEPFIRLEKLSLEATQRNDLLTIADLTIETRRNKAGATANYLDSAGATASGSLTSQAVDFSEFAALIPEMHVSVRPTVSLSGHLAHDSLFGSVRLVDDTQAIDLALTAYPFSKLLDDQARDSVGYSIRGSFERVDIARWLGDSTLAYSVNGRVELDGVGFTPEHLSTHFRAELNDCALLQYSLDTTALDMTLSHGMLDGSGSIVSDVGSLWLDSLAVDLFGAETYVLQCRIEGLDLAPLMNNDSLRSDIDLMLSVEGAYFDTAQATGNVTIALQPSTLYGGTITKGDVRLAFAPGQIDVDTLLIISNLAELRAGGNINGLSQAELNFVLTSNDLSRLHSYLGTDSLGGNVELNGALSGRLDSLAVSGTVTGNNLWYTSSRVEAALANFELALIDSSLLGTVDLRVSQISASGFLIDSIVGSADFSDSLVHSRFQMATPDGLAVRSEMDIARDTSVSATIRSLSIDYLTEHWSGGSPETKFSMDGDSYAIERLILTGRSDNAGATQQLTLNGSFSLTDREDLTIDYAGIALSPIADFMALVIPLDGRIAGKLHVGGTAGKPELTGESLLEGGMVQQFRFDSLALTYHYADEQLSWHGMLDPGPTGELTTSGQFPLHFSLTDSSDLLIPGKPMSINLAARQLPFSILGAVTDQTKITGGEINADIAIGGSWNKPDLAGRLTVGDASFEMKEIGAEYDALNMALSFNANSVMLDSLLVTRGKGFLRADGHLEFERDLMSGVLHSTDFTLVADKIFLARHKNFEIQISGTSGLQGSTSAPTFSGDIIIDRSKFYVPFLTEMATKTAGTLESPPMLLVALNPDSLSRDSIERGPDSSEVDAAASFDYYRNMRGELSLSIPRNTWLKSPEMNIEIAGDIRMVKNSPEDFELFGPITVVRGKYNMYGKEFVIREGTLNFTGSAEYNPDLNLIAQYIFRSPEREKHTLVATITGKAFTPQVTFSLDGGEITERDALAYVVFGRSMDEVTASGAGGGSGDMAKGVAANVLAGQLASTLGKSLALDVVEIDASSSLAGATITLGKYLTTDLFMSYQRGVGNPSEDEVTPVIVTLEYELTRNLALQLLQGDPKASGFDLVFKFAW